MLQRDLAKKGLKRKVSVGRRRPRQWLWVCTASWVSRWAVPDRARFQPVSAWSGDLWPWSLESHQHPTPRCLGSATARLLGVRTGVCSD